jgi:hypothetical protein
MKKFLILWFMLLFIVKCSTEETKVDPLQFSYKLNKQQISKSVIKDDLNYFLNKYNRTWSKQNKEKFVNVVYIGSVEFNINPKIVMSIISIESRYNIKAVGKNIKRRKVKSIDYGLCQINSKYLKQRYKATEEYLENYKIKYTDSKFDIGKNVFSCYMYLRAIWDYSNLIHFQDYILAYNQGVRGVKRNNNTSYYEKFLQEYMSI